MRLLHPIMPFLTEEVWYLLSQVAPQRGLGSTGREFDKLGISDTVKSFLAGVKTKFVHEIIAMEFAESICISRWPIGDASRQNATIEAQFADFQAVLGAIRETRQRQNIPFGEELSFVVKCDEATANLLMAMQPYFTQMAQANGAAWGAMAEPMGVPSSHTLPGARGPLEVHVDVSRFIDVVAERKRLEKQFDELTRYAESMRKKLANKGFVDKAPAEVVEHQRTKLAEVEGQLASVAAALEKFSGK
jgi:valyl-tRNA synthetase